MSIPSIFSQVCKQSGIPEPVAEFRFHDVRRWRFDYAFVEHRVALEVEGGLFMKGGGRHSRGAGARADFEKYNTAGAMGWIVLRCLPEQLMKAETLEFIRSAIAQRKAA